MTVNKPKRPNKGRSAGNPSNYSQLYKQSEQNMLQSTGATTPAAPAAAATVAQPVVQKTSNEIDWNREYGFVFKDLRYLLIVSAILFAAIVVIGFFL